MREPHNVLVVGLGRIGMGYDLRLDHAIHVMSHARAFSIHPAFELAGGVDTEAGKRETFTRTFDRPAFADLDAALDSTQPAIVVAAVPTSAHADVVRRSLQRASPTAIICEKPLSYDLAEAQVICDACEGRGVRLFVNYMRRSDPGAIEIARRLHAGEIAPPVKGVAWYSKGLLHNGSHLFNLLEWWLGPMRNAAIVNPGRMWNGIDPEPDVAVRFETGEVSFLAAREENFSHYTIELLAANGRVRYDKGGRQIGWQAADADQTFDGYVTLRDNVEMIQAHMDRFQYNVTEQLARALAGQVAHLSTGADALRTLEALTHIINLRCTRQ